MNPVWRQLLSSAVFVYHYLKDAKYREYVHLMHLCAQVPRYTEHTIRFREVEFHVPDVASFWSIYEEVICKRIYEFSCQKNRKPVIIDFGANIGLSVYYFLQNYPEAEIYAYEADPYIFKFLEDNVSQFDKLNNVHIFNQAIHDHYETLEFISEGADGGHIGICKGKEHVISKVPVNAVNAADILSKFSQIDMLKIDIEGAERYVIPVIKSQLHKVRNIFVEYHSEIGERQCLSEIVRIMAEAGFRLYMHPCVCAERPLIETRDNAGFDLEVNIFGRRE